MKRINFKQALVLLLGGALSLSLFASLFYSVPLGAKAIAFCFGLVIAYLTLRLAWIVADPEDEDLILKPNAKAALLKGMCPFCGESHVGTRRLKVGYRKPQITRLAYKVFWVELGATMHELNTHVPICDNCANRYLYLCNFKILARLGLDRSFIVLQRKPGYFRGARFPFEKWNIQIEEQQ